ncbi:MAG: DUF3048 domain-containing protein [Eubacteriales bacterium]
MKKLSVLTLAIISSTFLLFGCGSDESNTANMPEIIVEDIEASETVEEEITEVETDGDVPPEEGMVRSTLTNEWVDEEVASLRPIAVMIPNDASTIPQYNISNADIIYECLVEGGITRLMAIFEDWTELERIGNIRSCRDYYVYWAFEWDSVYIHAGGPFYIDEVIGRSDTNNINLLTAPSSVSYRSTDRSAPQNLYVDGKDVYDEIVRLDYSLTAREDYVDETHFKFASASEPNLLESYGSDAVVAKTIDLSDAYPVTETVFTFNETDGLYYRSQDPSDGAHMDAATDTQLAFSNVLIQFTYHEVRDASGYLAFQCIDSTRDGWFFTEGKGIHVNWIKTSDYSATRYYDDDGNEIELNTGKTAICIVQDGDTFSYEG